MNTPPEDLLATIRRVLRTGVPLASSAMIDRITADMAAAILEREQAFRDTMTPVSRADLLDRLERERYTPLPRREVAVSRPGPAARDVAAERLKILAEMPLSEFDEPEGE